MANQMTITFNIENQILRRTDPNKIIEKSKNYLFAEFSFSEDWDNTNKAIIFENNVLRYKIYLDSNNKCQVPNRIIRNDGFTISVVGEDNNDFVKITTSELYIAVGKGVKSEEEMESIYEITSQSLDVNKNGGTCNLEIKDEEKFYYEMQENDFSNMVSEGGNTWSLDLSETLENVITEFKKRIGVDWVALGLTPPVPSATKCVYSPTRKTFVMFGDEEITYYILSAVDGVGDTSTNFYYQNGSWHVTFFTGNLVDNETFNFRMAEKQDVLQAGEGITISGNEISTDRSKVVPNPTLVGDEPDLEGAEIDGIKYKVGGGGGATLDDIVDSQGNKRFIEGDGENKVFSNINNKYCKWSLSGTHLMLVFGGELSSKTSVSGGDSICDFILPEYIYNKIFPLLSTGIITFKDFKLRKLGQSDIDIYTYLIKKNNKISIESNTSGTFNSGYSFRFEFDLLIDADYSE